MTEENVNNTVQEKPTSENVENDGTVSYKTHAKLLDQRKADQAKLKELEATLSQFQEQQKKAEEERLRANDQYKELAEQKELELSKLLQERDQERAAAIKHQKILAFKETIGDLANPAYTKMVDWEAIQVDENGSVNIESLKEYGNQFRAEHASLFKNTNTPSPTSHAPSNYQTKTVGNAGTIEELASLWKKSGQTIKK